MYTWLLAICKKDTMEFCCNMDAKTFLNCSYVAHSRDAVIVYDFTPVEKKWKSPLAQDDSDITPVHYFASMNPPDALKCVFDCVPCNK